MVGVMTSAVGTARRIGRAPGVLMTMRPRVRQRREAHRQQAEHRQRKPEQTWMVIPERAHEESLGTQVQPSCKIS